MVGDYVLDAACGVVKRNRFDLRMPAEKVAALIERDGMRQDPAQRVELHSGRGNYVVHDAQMKFGLDKDSARHKKISMFGHGSGKRVFNGDDGRSDRATL